MTAVAINAAAPVSIARRVMLKSVSSFLCDFEGLIDRDLALDEF